MNCTHCLCMAIIRSADQTYVVSKLYVQFKHSYEKIKSASKRACISCV